MICSALIAHRYRMVAQASKVNKPDCPREQTGGPRQIRHPTLETPSDFLLRLGICLTRRAGVGKLPSPREEKPNGFLFMCVAHVSTRESIGIYKGA